MKNIFIALCVICLSACGKAGKPAAIDREALVTRNNPHVTEFDSLSSFSVGNGRFAVTVDATGLQTFPELYADGIPLGTQSEWGWHSFVNKEGYKHKETLTDYDLGHGRLEPYAGQTEEKGRKQDAENWFRANPHRLHLGTVGLELPEKVGVSDFRGIDQTLDMWRGTIHSRFLLEGHPVEVTTACHPDQDKLIAEVSSDLKLGVRFRFPYPSGEWGGDGCDWTKNSLHTTDIVKQCSQAVTLERRIDSTVYYVVIEWEGKADFKKKEKNCFVLSPKESRLAFTCEFKENQDNGQPAATVAQQFAETSSHWTDYWAQGAAVDFSACKDPRAKELERRVVLSQYLTAIQCAGSMPPQETGLTYNSWFGKFHLEMVWWHQAHFALWGHPEVLARTLDWYEIVRPVAKEIAERQGYKGVRWMKMTDPSGMEAPSSIGSFLVWQQPHFIYLAELLYRANPSDAVVRRYNNLVQETAEFMYSFASYDKANDRYVLKGLIPAQETLPKETAVNPPFELSYWHCAMNIAQKWRERAGEGRKPEWDEFIGKLSPLTSSNGLYLAAESAPDSYMNIRYISDHPAVLGAYGMLPPSRLADGKVMRNTLHWILDNWNWDHTWGWDYPMTAMSAVRMNEPEKAVEALLMDRRTNTYLLNGHNYQDGRLRLYLPGNGGLLAAVAMMCAGWDGCEEMNPGFPKDGNWNVRWEGLKPIP